ncbi:MULTISPECIES: EcoAI/FtnUII family type I restriction enzme subunit R [Methylomonas]|uniref:DEAD/DEAH box helicase n=1 Tax=Methylomonas methanica TaxID=421 RepID=A0A177MU83_METMH|nr:MULTISPECIES: DEAD/DEAH box helicase family protein [Methylomonas]OAI09296.1 DEAD/DEAH box helicase [Methylomonas methanica]PKM13729.1 MAG: DEAD/DEAH box helicase [Gammaproteobacteria bacterium HGW-Gammaproteobacteria-3]QBC26577.1 DEAD/DEAH box helicase [Methylomonas sp. LW13]
MDRDNKRDTIMTEADTSREFVTPKLVQAGWSISPHSIGEQRTFTNGRIFVTGGKVRRGQQKRADYLLYYRRDFPLAVVEVKSIAFPTETGVQQAREYAEILGLKFAYATNGRQIIEIDYTTGTEKLIDQYPSPAELWQRLSASASLSESASNHLLEPFNLVSGKTPRYYQVIAINRIIEAILLGQKRILTTMATGTGKTCVAFQLCWKLWNSRWNRTGEYRRPKILFLADRNILVDDPMAKMFAPFGDARFKISGNDVSQGREMYFGIYQALTNPASDVFRQYRPDFFDLIIIDECHRGSSRNDSSWRAVLDYFQPAVQVGMTATPLREDSRDSYEYFGNPVYTYSLRQGIEDGFLAPYRVHRVITTVDAAGWRPSKDELDRYGRPVPDDEYQTKDFERVIALRARTRAMAKHLSDFLKGTDRFAKTLVFCVDQEHASEMRQELLNLNSDLVKQYPDYVCRVTADEGAIGLTHLAHFQDVDKPTPAILTTSQLLTTGVDAEMVKNVVLARVVGSRSEFKQIVGRGTRLKVDYGKEYFNIIDFTGTATRHFADPDFDGDPARIEEVTIDEEGEIVDTTVEIIDNEVQEIPGEYQPDDDNPPDGDGEITTDPPQEPRKFYVDGGTVEVIGHLVYDLDTDGKKLQVVRYTEYSGRAVRSMYPGSQEFQRDWANPDTRSDLLRELTERGISFEELAASSDLPDADPFDLLCNLAWNAPLLTRRQRAEQARKSAQNLFSQHSETAREILALMLDKYIERGISQFNALSELMKVQPFEQYGTPTEIANRHFGGIQGLKAAVSQLQSALYQ